MSITKSYHFIEKLVKVATGKEEADVVVKNGHLVNVYSGEIENGIDVAIKGDRIALVGNVSCTIGKHTKVVNVDDAFILPGLIDAHMHIESSMLSPIEFAKAVLPWGTTTVFIDPHEIGNVFGTRGIRFFIDQTEGLPLKVFITIPSCVPPVAKFETSGAEIGVKEIEEMLGWERVVGLGEMMDFEAVISANKTALEKIRKALEAGKVVEGHAPMIRGMRLSAYISAGILSCHESTTKEEALEKVRRGMFTYVREGSAWLDVKECIRVITEEGISHVFVSLVTDDRDIRTIKRVGHMNHVVKRAIEEGLDPIKAIQMATINPALRFRMADELGGIAPFRFADLLIVKRLEDMKPEMVLANGVLVAKNGKLTIDIPKKPVPFYVLNSVKVKRKIAANDFIIKSDGRRRVRVIGVIEGSVLTKHLIRELPVSDGIVLPDPSRKILKVAVFERHGRNGTKGLGFVEGFGLRSGAVASTVAHDTHNLLVIGSNDDDMALAANRVVEIKGGISVVRSRKVVAELPLPIGGLMSDEGVEKVAKSIDIIEETWRKLGCNMVSPLMTMSLLTLTPIPELRITDRGLFDSKRFEPVDLFVD